MTAAGARRLAWGLSSAAAVLLVAGNALTLIAPSGRIDLQSGVGLTLIAVFCPVGVLIARSQPHNPLGWLFCGVGFSVGLSQLASGYTQYVLAGGGGSRALAETTAVYGVSSWIGWVVVPATFLLLLFPDGALLSSRWRVVGWCAAVGVAGEVLAGTLRAGPLEDVPQITNPYGVDFPAALEVIPLVLLAVAVVGSALSLVLRFRGATGMTRQQIKWLAYAGAVCAPTIVLAVVGYDVLGAAVANLVIQLAVLGLPLGAGVAILRYRLYDIDVVINRTLVYAGLTATLVATYLATILALQLALRPLTDRSDLAVAGSTLAVAAAFRPARSRIQAVVDRRFYRRRYDAARTLDAFAGRLRDELDLDALGGDLRTVVRDTVAPTHVSLWLRGAELRP